MPSERIADALRENDSLCASNLQFRSEIERLQINQHQAVETVARLKTVESLQDQEEGE